MPRFTIHIAGAALALLTLFFTNADLFAQQSGDVRVIPAALPSGATAKVGDASEITNRVTGTLASLHRNLHTGDEVFADETITTGSSSDGKFQLLDETTIAVGPNASIVLDKYVYDPANGAADVSITAMKGSFRFLSGTTPDTGYRIKTPTSVVGIRGTEFEVFVDDNGETAIALVSGEVEMCSLQQRCERLKEAGNYLRLQRDGRFIRARRAIRSILGGRASAARAFRFLHGKRKLGRLFERRRARIKQRRAGRRQNRIQRRRADRRQNRIQQRRFIRKQRGRAGLRKVQVRRNAFQRRQLRRRGRN